jgi:hypothetical protein
MSVELAVGGGPRTVPEGFAPWPPSAEMPAAHKELTL